MVLQIYVGSLLKWDRSSVDSASESSFKVRAFLSTDWSKIHYATPLVWSSLLWASTSIHCSISKRINIHRELANRSSLQNVWVLSSSVCCPATIYTTEAEGYRSGPDRCLDQLSKRTGERRLELVCDGSLQWWAWAGCLRWGCLPVGSVNSSCRYTV